MLGMLSCASKGSLLVTFELEVARRMFVVEALAVPVPWFRIVKLTVTFDPASPLVGLRERLCATRSGAAALTANDVLVRSFASFALPWPAELVASRMIQTYFVPLLVPAGIVTDWLTG